MRTGLTCLKERYPIHSPPYRLAVEARTDFQLLLQLIQQGHVADAVKFYAGPLLPESEVSFVTELRTALEEPLRQAVLLPGDGETLFTLARKLGSDLEMWEQAVARLPAGHQSHTVATALLAIVKARWEE